MITIKFSSTFQNALCQRVERHQKLITDTIESRVEEIYSYMISEIRYYHENRGSWSFWLDKKMFSDRPLLSLYYSGDTFTKEDIHEWIKTGVPKEFGYYGVISRVSLAKETIDKLKKAKQYKYALMLLKYCSSFETVTVPLDFLLWFEK